MLAIINLRGTGGSGKSTVVRRIMDLYASKAPMHVEGRKQPIGYYLGQDLTIRLPGVRPLFVPGHYEKACGGCDTIKTSDQVYSLIRTEIGSIDPPDVLYEGIMVQDEIDRAVALNREHKILVIGLNTKIEECLAGIQARRDARGETKPLNPKNTIDREKRVRRTLDRLEAAGVEVLRLDREAAFQECKGRLGW